MQISNKKKVNTKGKFNKSKLIIAIMTVITAMTTMGVTAYATPAGVDTGSMTAMIDIVFWAVRIIIAAVGGLPSLIKVVQGQSDEDPRSRNAGFVGLIVTGVIIGATFAVKTAFFD